MGMMPRKSAAIHGGHQYIKTPALARCFLALCRIAATAVPAGWEEVGTLEKLQARGIRLGKLTYGSQSEKEIASLASTLKRAAVWSSLVNGQCPSRFQSA